MGDFYMQKPFMELESTQRIRKKQNDSKLDELVQQCRLNVRMLK